MAFYFQPASGYISLKKLEIFAVNRLRFLIQTNLYCDDRLRMLDMVNSLQSVADSDCLIEGSQKDNISHYILRLLFVDEETEDFFVRAESVLFKFRFSCLTEYEIYKTLKSSQKHLKLNKVPTPCGYNSTNIDHVLSTLQALRQSAGSWKNVAQCYIHNRSRKQFQVPFQAVTSLVARRRVEIHNGWAHVSYDDLEEVLTSLFQSTLKLSLSQVEEKQEMAFGDDRMKRLSGRLKMIYRRQMPKQVKWNDLPCLSHDQVDQSEDLFPLCMSNLHYNLRTAHRLKHNDRIQYSLFLKEVGMPVHQAVQFWSREYSKPGLIPNSHSWQGDGPRYLYSIRHLYGLEGARRNYRSHCCSSLQRRQLGPYEQGGCPFVHFDDGNLGNLLTANHIEKEDQSKLLTLRAEGRACDACKVYLTHKIDSHWTTVTERSPGDSSLEEVHQKITAACGQSVQHSSNVCSKHHNADHNRQTLVDGNRHQSVEMKKVLDNETDIRNRCLCNCNSNALDHTKKGFVACHFGDEHSRKCETQDMDSNMCSATDVIDVDQVAACSSDDDVICLKVTTNRETRKRRSLSFKPKSSCKKQTLWYESSSHHNESRQITPRRSEASPAPQMDFESHCTETVLKTTSRTCSSNSNTSETVSKLEYNNHLESETSRPNEESFNPDNKHLLNRNSKCTTIMTQSLFTSKGDNSCRHLSCSGNDDSRNERCTERPSRHANCKDDINEISSTSSHCIKGDNSSQNLDTRTDGNIKDEDSCFEHDFCQSQVDSKSVARKLSELKAMNTQNRSDRLHSVHIHKPVDFYVTFRELVAGLKSQTQS